MTYNLGALDSPAFVFTYPFFTIEQPWLVMVMAARIVNKCTAFICVATELTSSASVLYLFKVTQESYAGSFPAAWEYVLWCQMGVPELS